MKTSTWMSRTALIALLAAAPLSAKADILFWSTQANPVEETQAMREDVLSGFDDAVDYQPSEAGPWLTRMQAEIEAGSGTIGVLGGLHGDFTSLEGDLVDLSGVDIGGVKVNEAFMKLGQLEGSEQKLHALDAGDLRDGRQQEGAGASARRCRHHGAQL